MKTGENMEPVGIQLSKNMYVIFARKISYIIVCWTGMLMEFTLKRKNIYASMRLCSARNFYTYSAYEKKPLRCGAYQVPPVRFRNKNNKKIKLSQKVTQKEESFFWELR